MTTFTELVATVVVHSSAFALSHFGVTQQPVLIEKAPPSVERVIVRTPTGPQAHKGMKLTSCPQARHRVHAMKA